LRIPEIFYLSQYWIAKIWFYLLFQFFLPLQISRSTLLAKMAEFVSTPNATHWQDQHLEHSNNAYSPTNESPADTFSRFANGGAADVEYRGSFQAATDGPEYQTETYPPPDFGETDYQQPDYKWPTPATSSHQEPLSPRHSVPHSPVDQVGSPQKVQEEDLDDAQDDKLDDIDEEPTRQSAADRRNEKRKMKRFRLTHQQTRFLMSEFARQAHPDAAHRERLSRHIPGLSPRQVQVWFQNR
jgi:hypothetical protein